jgi:hypothetical protein
MLSAKGANLQGRFDAFGASADTQCPQDVPNPFRIAYLEAPRQHMHKMSRSKSDVRGRRGRTAAASMRTL